MGCVKMEAVKRKLSRLSRNVKLLLLWFCLTLALLLAEITLFHFVLELKTLLSFCILPFLGFVLVFNTRRVFRNTRQVFVLKYLVLITMQRYKK